MGLISSERTDDMAIVVGAEIYMMAETGDSKFPERRSEPLLKHELGWTCDEGMDPWWSTRT